VQGARRLAALGVRIIRDARTVPDVRRGDNKFAHKARGVRGIRPEGGLVRVGKQPVLFSV